MSLVLRRPRTSLTLLVAMVLGLAAQGPSISAGAAAAVGTGSISGNVTAVGAAGPPDLWVDVLRADGGQWVMVDGVRPTASGDYTVGGLAAGSYRLRFNEYDGFYVSEYFDDAATVDGAVDIVVGDGAAVTVPNEQLAVAAHLIGHVADPTGAPVESVRVTAYTAGAAGWQPVVGPDGLPIVTDAGGLYNIGGLTAGTYRVGFDAPGNDYVDEFFADAPSVDLANDIALLPAESRAEIDVTLAVSPTAPVRNVSPPTVAGAAQVGQSMTASPGTWTAAGATFGYQWLASGAPIAGAVGRTFVPTATVVGQKLSVRVRATVVGVGTGTARSAPTTSVLPAGAKVVDNSVLPKVKGTLKVGRTVKVTTGVWTPRAVKLKYQWSANGKKIKKATRAKLRLTARQRGKRLSVKVTASASGHAATSVTTRRSAKVRG